MRLFVDSGQLAEIQNVMSFYSIAGVTTNPKITTEKDAEKIVETLQVPTSLQVDVYNDDVLDFAIRKHRMNSLYNIKVPVSHLNIAKQIIDSGVPLNLTLCFRLVHVIAAVNLKAKYVSIFVGRMLDNFEDAHDLIRSARRYIDLVGSETEIIAASIRNADHIELACKAGAHIVTVPTNVLKTAMDHELTKSGLADFNQYFGVFM